MQSAERVRSQSNHTRSIMQSAMTCALRAQSGITLPPPWAPAQSIVRVFVIYDHESAQMLAELRGAVASRHWSHRIKLLDERMARRRF